MVVARDDSISVSFARLELQPPEDESLGVTTGPRSDPSRVVSRQERVKGSAAHANGKIYNSINVMVNFPIAIVTILDAFEQKVEFFV
jgi:hypothetical protein